MSVNQNAKLINYVRYDQMEKTIPKSIYMPSDLYNKFTLNKMNQQQKNVVIFIFVSVLTQFNAIVVQSNKDGKLNLRETDSMQ